MNGAKGLFWSSRGSQAMNVSQDSNGAEDGERARWYQVAGSETMIKSGQRISEEEQMSMERGEGMNPAADGTLNILIMGICRRTLDEDDK